MGDDSFWSKDGKGFINARCETAADKPTFRTSFKSKDSLSQQMDFMNGKRKASKNSRIISDKIMENLLHLLDFTIPGELEMKRLPLSPY